MAHLIHHFVSGEYRVDFTPASGAAVTARVTENRTGREVSLDSLDPGLKLRIQDEETKALDLLRADIESREADEERAREVYWDYQCRQTPEREQGMEMGF